MRPRVSVIMPVYNAEAYLREVLDALDAQTCPSMEVIAVDDGSRDRSGSLLDAYAGQHPWLRVIHKRNEGIFRARETGISEARGEYIGFCDNDDLPSPELYQKLYDAASQAGADMAVCSFVREEMETGRVLSHEMTSLAGRVIDLDSDPTAMAVINTSPWNKLYRAELLRKAGTFDPPPRLLEDVILNASVYPLMHRVVIIPDMLYRYRIRRDSSILTINKGDLPTIERCLLSIRSDVEQSAAQNSAQMLRLLDSMAFIHLGVSVVLRRIQGGDSIRQAVADARGCLDRGFPLYGRPEYGLGWNIRNGGVMLKPLIALRCFQLRLMGPLFAVYRLVTEKLHREIKW